MIFSGKLLILFDKSKINTIIEAKKLIGQDLRKFDAALKIKKTITFDDVKIDEAVITSINSNLNNVTLNVYPNPNSGVFTLNVNTTEVKELDIKVMNAQGQIVFSKNNFDNLFHNIPFCIFFGASATVFIMCNRLKRDNCTLSLVSIS